MKHVRQISVIGLLLLFCLNVSYAMYDPQAGRFMQRDPLGIDPAGKKFDQSEIVKQYSNGLNLYEYVKSNASSHKDPFGTNIYLQRGNNTKNPVNNLLHMSVCVDLWKRCCNSGELKGSDTFFAATLF